MSSGIVQLIAVGAQDEHIIGDPEISFSRRHLSDTLTFTVSRETNNTRGCEK